MSDFASIADVLDRAATAMETNPALDPDGAVRLAVWGDPETPYPGDQQPGADTFDQAEIAIESWVADKHGYNPGGGIDHLDRTEAIEAARAGAARFRSYGGDR
ncbi:hypothetical protein [Streptomyces sp. NPDC059597]|uniref:hypothetical protein n=1 Tax=Streptomyces sp. NPDC059597 TaxID=3346879 RepID=UPI0036AB0C32